MINQSSAQIKPKTSDNPETNPNTPGAYDLLVQVLGDRERSSAQSSAAPTSTPQNRPPANATAKTQSRERLGSSVRTPQTQSRETKERREAVSEDYSDDHRKVATPRSSVEPPRGNVTAPRAHTYKESTRNSTSPSTGSQSQSTSDYSGDTPKTLKDHSTSSGSNRKRTRDNNIVYTPKPDTSNPTGEELDRVSFITYCTRTPPTNRIKSLSN